jgi:anti-sigma regulatory factor (Ser/Thr protein kinase)
LSISATVTGWSRRSEKLPRSRRKPTPANPLRSSWTRFRDSRSGVSKSRETLRPKRGRVKSVSDLRESEPSLQLRLEALPESMAVLRRHLRRWLDEAGATDRELFEIQLAVTEAFANAVEHPEEPTSHLVEIKGTVTNRTVAISVRDYGRWQDESSAKLDGGLGLAIMDTLMDSLVVEPLADGTTATMHRRLTMR